MAHSLSDAEVRQRPLPKEQAPAPPPEIEPAPSNPPPAPATTQLSPALQDAIYTDLASKLEALTQLITQQLAAAAAAPASPCPSTAAPSRTLTSLVKKTPVLRPTQERQRC